MPKLGYKQSQEHKNKIVKNLKPFSKTNRQNAFGLGSKHKKETILKMRGFRKDNIIRKDKPVYSKEEYTEMLIKQDNRCAICGSYQDKKKFCVDHCHKTKKIRGLLCFHCNVGIGHLKDNIQILQNAISYLEINQ